MGKIEVTTGAATEKLLSLIAEVFRLGSVTHTINPKDRSAMWPKVIANSAPALSIAALRQGALLGYLALAKGEDRWVFTVSALGRHVANIRSERKQPVYRKDACPKCGRIADHWIAPNPDSANTRGEWLCDSIDFDKD